MSANGSQVWVCCACENPRQYGDGYPEEIVNKQLGCSYCGKVTAHRFSHVDWDEPSGRGGFRPGAGRKAKEAQV